MKSMDRLACSILNDIGRLYHVDTTRDEQTLISRIREEGQSFLTITLPSFENDLLRSIELGFVESSLFSGFRRKNGLPLFLGGFLTQLFPEGQIGQCDNPGLLRDLRQFLSVFKKVERECTPKRVNKALANYHLIDASIPELSSYAAESLTKATLLLFGDFFGDVENTLYNEGITPRHSSGALATRESYNGRFSSVRWSAKLQKVFPDWDFLYSSYSHMMESETIIDQEGCEPPAKVITVPKTQKTPRIIAMEPVYNQYVQQGILRLLTSTLRLPKHRQLWRVMCWDTQDYNRRLAQVGSECGRTATLDLSEASDRVSLQHIEAMLKPFPLLWEAVLACRSSEAVTPFGTVKLRKFASMGSSLCFPFETILFTVLSWMGMEEGKLLAGYRPARPGLWWGSWRVYGDDIIVPQNAVDNDTTYDVIRMLESYGLKVNGTKSFWNGNFRESCGGDYLNGVDVTVHRLGVDVDPHIMPIEDFERVIHFRNFLYEDGYWDAAVKCLDEIILRQRRVPYTPLRPLVGISLLGEGGTCKFDKNLQVTVWKVLRLRRNKPSDPLDGWGALMKFFLGGDEPLERNHLERDGRSRCAGIHIGWSAIN